LGHPTSFLIQKIDTLFDWLQLRINPAVVLFLCWIDGGETLSYKRKKATKTTEGEEREEQRKEEVVF